MDTILIRWALLISLAARCETLCAFSDYTPDAREIYMRHCGLTSINTTELERFTNVQLLSLDNNDLKNFPNLSPIAGTLRTLWLNSNNISVMSNDALFPLTNLRTLSLRSITNLKHFPHPVNGLRILMQLKIDNTSISYLPPILFDNIADMKVLNISNSVDVCQCENAWLKQEGPKVADFQYDDADCGDHRWSSMTMDGFDKKCEKERNLKEKKFALAKGVTTKMSLKTFLLHSHDASILKIECTMKCLHITGCVSFYWRRLHDRLGDCVIIAPGNSINVESVPDGNLEVWTYFYLQ